MATQNKVRATIILRNDSAETWATKDPILARGEIGAEIDTGLLKLGDGLTSYNNLPYINSFYEPDGVLIKVNDNDQLTIGNYGKSYWEYNAMDMVDVEVQVDANHPWPANAEFEVKNGQARWVKPKATYNRTEGKIDGILVTLAGDPQSNNDAATKNYVDSTIAEKIAQADHLKRLVVTELPQSNIKSNTIYMVKDNTVTGADKYREYLLIDGVLTQIGDTSVDLSNYVEKPTVIKAGNLITITADGNLIDSGIASTDVNKLNIATTDVLGGVRSSNADNNISVDNITGFMTLNRVSTNKLYVPDGDEFILNGGTA